MAAGAGAAGVPDSITKRPWRQDGYGVAVVQAKYETLQ